MKLSIDSTDNKIWAKGLVGGTVYGVFTITVNGFLPMTATTVSFTFNLAVDPCAHTLITYPSLTTQIYYVTNPTGSYSVPAFTTTTLCADALIYTNSIAPTNTWITGVTDNSGNGRDVSWQTNVEANVALYTVTIAADSVN